MDPDLLRGSVANAAKDYGEWLMPAISGGDLEDLGNEGSLRRHVPSAGIVCLPLPDHRHRLVAGQRPPGSGQAGKAKPRSHQSFDPLVILLDSSIASEGDRQMVQILAAVLSDGLAAVEAACGEALRDGTHAAAVVLNILARHREPAAAASIVTPDALRLTHTPMADCPSAALPTMLRIAGTLLGYSARYDSLRRAP